jgi:radical SAM superfamily enzyme YgiQ (UPF0313 family)
MRILFIRPNLAPRRSSDAMEPLVFAVLRALTPPDIACRLVDERLEAVPLDAEADLAALTVETFTARRAYQIADAYRARGIPVVLGGYHPTFCPEEAGRHADAVVTGDAEAVWPAVVADARAGRLQPVYAGGAADMTQARFDRSIFAGKRYSPIRLVQYGRGCRFHCDFCSIHAFYGRHRRQRPLHDLLAELESLHPRHVFFVDDNLFTHARRVDALCDALQPLGIRWSCQISLDIASDPNRIRRMARAGCLTMTMGFESLDPANLRQMHKGANLRFHDYHALLAMLRDNGILVYGTFVFGYDHDTPETIERTLAFALQEKLFLANFNPLTPTPATALYQRLQQEGRLLFPTWWTDPAYRYGQTIFRPRGMTPEQLEEGCFHARTTFNQLRHLLARANDRKAHLRNPYNALVYAAANWTSRREIRRKQGSALGAKRVNTDQ